MYDHLISMPSEGLTYMSSHLQSLPYTDRRAPWKQSMLEGIVYSLEKAIAEVRWSVF